MARISSQREGDEDFAPTVMEPLTAQGADAKAFLAKSFSLFLSSSLSPSLCLSLCSSLGLSLSVSVSSQCLSVSPLVSLHLSLVSFCPLVSLAQAASYHLLSITGSKYLLR